MKLEKKVYIIALYYSTEFPSFFSFSFELAFK